MNLAGGFDACLKNILVSLKDNQIPCISEMKVSFMHLFQEAIEESSTVNGTGRWCGSGS